MTINDFIIRELSILQTHIWFLHGQFVAVLALIGGVALQIRRNGNGKK